ncbi:MULTISPECIES: hypothetical protein [unclassified Empedobacter]|uniref:hypothetical protein n=2 Tax=unclassified Empedobacter TaxID=2643773 RepID=UPI0025B989FB|nr:MULTISPECIES: hypothetical protein [unclassified Empedobacter]
MIDDKKLRQEKDYNWSTSRFEEFNDIISPIYTLDELTQNSKKIFKEGNVVLYHESFLDLTPLRNEAIDRRKGIEEKAISNNLSVVFFSGSKNSRDIKNNIANIPVSAFYNNLEIFLEKYRNEDLNLNYLLFGENYKLEEDLQTKIKVAVEFSQTLPPLEIDDLYLHIRPAFNSVKNLFTKAKEQVVFNNVSDNEFSSFIFSNLNKEEYKTIYLPISLGSVLSDFNGLRLATHIRCTSTLNQLTPIVIYSNIDLSYLLGNEYFNILNTKNIFFVNYMIDSFDLNLKSFTIEDLPSEMAKLKLEVPKDYYDNHSVANEWGIYQLARNANIPISNVEGFDQKKLETIYFKWLIAKNNLLKPIEEEVIVEQKKYSEQLSGLKVLGKIDVSKFSKK